MHKIAHPPAYSGYIDADITLGCIGLDITFGCITSDIALSRAREAIHRRALAATDPLWARRCAQRWKPRLLAYTINSSLRYGQNRQKAASNSGRFRARVGEGFLYRA